MKKISLLISIFLFAQYLHAQVSFQKTYGRAGSDGANDIQLTTDGGYIIAGWTGTPGGSMQDAALVKTDSNGDTLWTKSYGGNNNEYFRAVVQTGDGGYIATGSTNSGFPDNNLYLVKTDFEGNMIWAKTYAGPSEEIGNDVKETSDGGYIITGQAGLADLYLIRTDSAGDTLWTKVINGGSGESVVQTNDGGFMVGGEILAAGSETIDFYIIRTNGNGDTLWTKIYGGTATETGRMMAPTSDGGYILAGATTSFGSDGNVYLVKTDSSGQVQWSKTFGGSASDVAYAVQEASDGGYIVSGITASFGISASAIYLIKTDYSGTLQWSYAYGSTAPEIGYSVRQTSDGGFIVAGQTWSFGGGGQAEMYVVKTDSLGNSGCFQTAAATQTTVPPTQSSIFSKAIQPGGAIAIPSVTVSSGLTVTTICAVTGIEEILSQENGIDIFPNPSSGSFTISFEKEIAGREIKIYNLLGDIIFRKNISTSSQKIIFPENISSGIYFVRVFDGDNNVVRKLVVE